MSMRSRKKEIYWSAPHQRVPSQLLKELKVLNSTKFRKTIGLNIRRVFGSDPSTACDWLNTKATALNGMRPLDLLKNGNIAIVQDYLTRLEHCVYM